ncbi:hypothetical protein GCM10011504_24350 [Siccirubricoccus deserti]|uniref:Transglycosylase SLT domain-containing protein n=1 Tax=Siccirubricoccus deserti TaxID=2013562 RepID=A0A9X0QXV9_9PROT|nr:transglycosylase SLT domain-containing protein [Siccirubricoccus deserti]MBC4015844.1 transglycosylase SLT domain-containing protein [Siccirubricoccus deserti]GGC45089.1 hypothetical protein GCM10011504_24350 [Siccirubricoccus deserti]
MRHVRHLALFLGVIAVPARAQPLPEDPGLQCRRAIAMAEREYRLPAGLLPAIARVESVRPDPVTGAPTPWPWTINAEGRGRFFDTKAEAVAAVEALRARGVRVIDVGCLQVNLHHHPTAFASLEEAFAPAANARYAATFLRSLYSTRRDWEISAAHYHSTTPERAEAYRLKVLAAWPAMAARLAELRRREAMAQAWGASRGAANGFQAVALSLGPRAAAGARRGLLDPAPTRVAPPRRAPAVEVAEAWR